MSERVATSGEADEYVLGTHDAEVARLGLQHRLWRGHALSLWERAGFGPGQTAIDLGAGPGYTTRDIARLVGTTGRVIGVDVSDRFLDILRVTPPEPDAAPIEARRADVRELGLPAGVADRAYARWLLCFLQEPERVVAELRRTLKVGGVVAFQDYLHYTGMRLFPRSAAFERVVQAVDRNWRETGGNPDVCSVLPTLLRRNGFVVREVVPIVRLARPQVALWRWPTTFFLQHAPLLESRGLISTDDRLAFEADWAAATANPEAVFVTPMMADIIAERV